MPRKKRVVKRVTKSKEKSVNGWFVFALLLLGMFLLTTSIGPSISGYVMYNVKNLAEDDINNYDYVSYPQENINGDKLNYYFSIKNNGRLVLVCNFDGDRDDGETSNCGDLNGIVTEPPENVKTVPAPTRDPAQQRQEDGNYYYIDSFFTQWSQGDLDTNVAKWFVFMLLVLLFYIILRVTGFPWFGGESGKRQSGKGANWLRWPIAIIIAFLATAYVAPGELFAVLTSYTALFFTFGLLIPFGIILLGTAGLLEAPTVPKILLQLLVWILYLAFLLYKLMFGYYNGIEIDQGIQIMMFILLGLVFLIIAFNKIYRTFIEKLVINVKIMAARNEMTDSAINAARSNLEKNEDEFGRIGNKITKNLSEGW